MATLAVSQRLSMLDWLIHHHLTLLVSLLKESRERLVGADKLVPIYGAVPEVSWLTDQLDRSTMEDVNGFEWPWHAVWRTTYFARQFSRRVDLGKNLAYRAYLEMLPAGLFGELDGRFYDLANDVTRCCFALARALAFEGMSDKLRFATRTLESALVIIQDEDLACAS